MPEECAVREVLEESGLRVKNPRLHGILTFPLFSGGKDWYVFVYVFDDFDGNLIESDEGQLAWIDDNELLNLNLWEGDLYFLRWINEKRFFSGKFIYEAGRLQDYKVIFHDI
jgi:8-oxo-dGTP diphosphatase